MQSIYYVKHIWWDYCNDGKRNWSDPLRPFFNESVNNSSHKENLHMRHVCAIKWSNDIASPWQRIFHFYDFISHDECVPIVPYARSL